jgi:NADPH-dependent 2,4-dienoyl-CoA reductase/sulfur reductase-like enzyme
MADDDTGDGNGDRDPFVVVGGDAAGLSAASKCRRTDPDREVVVLERGAWVSYAHCGTPYYVKGEIDRLDDLTSLSAADVADRGIDLRRGHEVRALDPDADAVAVEGPDGRYELPFGDLLVATGARAVSEPFPGLALDRAFTLHALESAAALRALVTPPDEPVPDRDEERLPDGLVARHAAADPPETAAIVGGGYVGVEVAEALHARGIAVHLFQRSDRLLVPFGAAAGERVAEHLREAGIELHLDTVVESIRDDGAGGVGGVVTDAGAVAADAAVVGVGVRPNVAVATDGAGVERGASGAIAVDRYGRTSRPGVYAAGDCAEARHVVTGEPAWVPLGLTANRAGRAVGATVGGEPTPTGGTAGTAAVKALATEAGRTGLVGDEQAREAGFEPATATITAGSRSGYYPGAAETTVTLTADRGTGRLLGGALAGPDRAAIRIDTLATALAGGLTVAELERTDLAYAPPFSPVWDPVLVAAKVLHGRLP